MSPADWIQLMIAIGTLVGVILILLTVRSDHDWRRRQQAIEIMAGWNANTSASVTALEKHLPHIRFGKTVSEITKAKAREIFMNEPESEANEELRTHIVRLLNHFDYVAAAYSHGVADKEIIEFGLRTTITRWYDVLQNFIHVTQEIDGKTYWTLLEDVIHSWKTTPQFKIRRPTA